MGEKTASVGHFQIPTAPAALTAVAQSASANTLGAAVSFGNAPSTMFITGVTIGVATTQVPTYVQIQILVAAGIVASVLVPYGVSSAAAASVLTGYRPIYPPIPVASGAAITVKSASSVASAVAWGVSLECIAQANVVDDGVAVATVTSVTNPVLVSAGTGAGQLDFTSGVVKANLAQILGTALTETAGQIAAAFKKFFNIATPASTMDALTLVATATNLTNAPTAGDFTAAMKTSLNAATPASVTGSVASVTAAVTLPTIPNNWISAAGIAAAALNGKGDWLLSSGYTAPLTAVTTRAALGLASANLDTQLSAIAGFVDTEVASVLTDTATILSRLTAGRASNLDFLDVSVASRLATAGYTAPPSTASIADKILGRNLAGSVDGGRTMADAMRALRNKTALAGGVLTVYAEDDTTPAWTAAVTTAVRDPLASVDPT